MVLGARIHVALLDLAFSIEPRLMSGDSRGRRIRPWLGLLVILLLVAGLAFVGNGAVWAIHEFAPHRENRP